MQLSFPKYYSFFPRTFSYPSERKELIIFLEGLKSMLIYYHIDEKKKVPLICKPSKGCQGKGIIIATKVSDIPTDGDWVIQEYVNEYQST